MICPLCNKGEVVSRRSTKGIIFFRKIITYYHCPLCTWTNQNIMPATEKDIRVEEKRAYTEATGTTTHIEGYQNLNKPKGKVQW